MLRPPETEKGPTPSRGIGPSEDDSKPNITTTIRQRSKQSPQAKWTEKNPLKRWAHLATASAIKRGLLVRRPCENCGSGPTDAHHPDHRLPLQVQFLCRRCHKAEEKRLKGGAG